MENEAHRICLYLVFSKRIQASLDRTQDTWNQHKIRTEHNRCPVALYELSREKAIVQGYWTGDPGDPAEDVLNDAAYGIDGEAPLPPACDSSLAEIALRFQMLFLFDNMSLVGFELGLTLAWDCDVCRAFFISILKV